MSLVRRPEAWVFVILLTSYAYFWHSRDWNTASRLMLSYALVDRGTVCIDGLDDQTGDKAWFRGRYYSDKLPGFSLLAAAPYGLARGVFALPAHPLKAGDVPYWKTDYWATVGTSGLLTALCGALLVRLAMRLGCGPGRAALVGLAYGLATPAYVYATLAYGHQASALLLLASFALLWDVEAPRPRLRVFAAGVLAAYASVVELQVGPVSAILGFYLLAQVVRGKRRPGQIGEFAVGALLPTLLLLGYNQLAFGSPWDMGYFHHVDPVFHQVHSARNPLGLRWFDWSHASDLLWGGYRGLSFYAPILLLALPGWVVLIVRRRVGVAVVSAAVVAAVFLVNLSYPEWTGGWSTGPRLLVPLLPFAMLPVAALLAPGGRLATAAAMVLALLGAVLMLLFQGVEARIPQFIADPLFEAVLPLWRGAPLPSWAYGRRFCRTVIEVVFPSAAASPSDPGRWVQFVPLVAFQAVAVAAMFWITRARKEAPEPG
jgi:hypothetical protein